MSEEHNTAARRVAEQIKRYVDESEGDEIAVRVRQLESDVTALREQLAHLRSDYAALQQINNAAERERRSAESQLAQVEQERDAAQETLHSMTEAMAESNRRRTL